MPRLSAAFASLAAVAPERAVREAAGEVCRRREPGAQPARSFSAPPIERLDTSYEDAQLAVMLASIADEVQARTAALCAGIEVEFSERIRLAQTTLPRDHVTASVAALKQAKREALKFVRETAASEIRERRKQAATSSRRKVLFLTRLDRRLQK